jgi:riboflavin kinase/FMN adenylyltransferase
VYRWQGLDEVPAEWGESVVTIGVFDGVHRGHQRIVARAAELGRERGLPVVAITFDPHPDEVIRPGSHPPFLCSARRRAELLAGLGVDAVCMVPFTLRFSRIDPDEFVRTVLVEKLHAAAVVVGEDFRFGHKATGDVQLLDKLGEKYDYTVEGLPLLVLDDVTISSTAIRTLLDAGDVAEAAKLLGRPHRVEGIVVRGHQRGRQLGFPTANVESPPHTAIPADGIYAGWLATLDETGGVMSRWPVRPRPDRPGPLRPARRDRFRRPPPRHPPLRLHRRPRRANAQRRRPGPRTLRPPIAPDPRQGRLTATAHHQSRARLRVRRYRTRSRAV